MIGIGRRRTELVVSFLVSLPLFTSATVQVQPTHEDHHPRQHHQWSPESPHPCTVDRFSVHEVREKFGPAGVPAFYPTPLVVTTAGTEHDNGVTRQRVQEDVLLTLFPPDFNVTLSSSNSFSQHRRTIALEQYLREMKLHGGITSPHQRSNESWYLFGETFGEDWKHLLRDYQLPPCRTCLPQYTALSFGIGNRGSGVQWHIHGPGFSQALVGRKHWLLYPPQYPPPFFHPNQSTRNWMEHIYSNATKLLDYAQQQQQQVRQGNTTKRTDSDPLQQTESIWNIHAGRPYECTLEPGDMIYFPDRWHHATINCDFYTAFVSSFTSDFMYQQDQKNQKKGGVVFSKEEL